jgi:hypothetical protein
VSVQTPHPVLGFTSAAFKDIVSRDQKPLGRLYKMCDPFFHEFRVIPSANGFLLVSYTATLFTTEAVCYRVDSDRRLAHLSRMGGAVGHDFFSHGSIKEQAA